MVKCCCSCVHATPRSPCGLPSTDITTLPQTARHPQRCRRCCLSVRAGEAVRSWSITVCLEKTPVLTPSNICTCHTAANPLCVHCVLLLLAEHRNRTRCEGDRMLLHCRYPKLLNIYSAVYGREPEQREVCPTEEEQRPPPYECLYHGALDAVRSKCYGKQRCFLSVDDQHFRNPCPPGAKKYLTVLYSCVPQTLFKQADPDLFKTTPIPHETTEAEDQPQVRDSRLPEQRAVIVSNSLMAFVFIKEHPEMAGLLFISSVCLGLLVVLLAISTRLTCTGRPKALNCLRNTKADEKPDTEDEDDDNSEDDEDESEPLMDRSLMSEQGGKVYHWEDVEYTTEAAELMERLERRDLIIQEIRMNAYLNGNSYSLR
ncbi:protein eva-1 homolog C isoform X2 [Trichomycterus rosablanca]|uniref:protein eva-1 homolog C isoform X2 n=1 Tax=Trichomycterus rosablanca TaxID=2290929 RepID=UPI002F351B35